MEMQEPFMQSYITAICITCAAAVILARHVFKGWPKPLGCVYCMSLWCACLVGIIYGTYEQIAMYWLVSLLIVDKLPEA